MANIGERVLVDGKYYYIKSATRSKAIANDRVESIRMKGKGGRVKLDTDPKWGGKKRYLVLERK